MPAPVQVLVLSLAPALALGLERRFRWARAVSAVVLCYAVGMLLGNVPMAGVDRTLSLGVCQAAVGLAIPLLVFSVDLAGWLRMSRATVVSFAGCVGAVLVASSAGRALFADVEQSPAIAGMLVGVYTGGSPNLNAIGTALGVSEETLVMVNGADILLGSAFLLALLTVVPRLLARVLPPYPRRGAAAEPAAAEPDAVGVRDLAVGIVLAAVVVGLAVAVGLLAPERAREPVVLLVLTTLAVAASLRAEVRALRGTHQAGQYLLLVFAVAIGSTADLAELATTSVTIVLYTATVLSLAVVVHAVFCMLFRIDRDTAVITATAAIYGPPFVGVVATTLRNREVVVAGLASGLVGLAIGNYLGLALAWLLS